MHIDDLTVRALAAGADGGDGEPHHADAARSSCGSSRGSPTPSIFEEFIQRKFVGAKSFSLEGAESLIPLLDLAIEKAGEQGVDEIVLAMAHRGRLNVLANIMGKSPQRDLPRVRGRRSAAAPRPRRREVSPGLLQRLDHQQRAEGAPLALLQPEPPGVRQPGGAGPHAGQAGPRRRRAARARAGAC